MRLVLTIMCLFVLGLGCAPHTELTPAPSAQLLPGRVTAAVAEVAGVRVVVGADKWAGQPAELPWLIPLHVTISNHSGNPLRLRYNEFTLEGPTSMATAIPPYQIEPTLVSPLPHPAFRSHRFWIAPHHRYHFAHMHPWHEPFPFDHTYYRHHYGLWGDGLPTRDMLHQALPEGVVEDGGMIAGFVYFRNVAPNLPQVTFTLELIDANTAEPFGLLRIPFVVVET